MGSIELTTANSLAKVMGKVFSIWNKTMFVFPLLITHWITAAKRNYRETKKAKACL